MGHGLAHCEVFEENGLRLRDKSSAFEFFPRYNLRLHDACLLTRQSSRLVLLLRYCKFRMIFLIDEKPALPCPLRRFPRRVVALNPFKFLIQFMQVLSAPELQNL